MATHYKFNLSAYIQELLVMCWRGCAGRDLNEETLAVDSRASSPVRKSVAYESDVSEGVQVTVILIKNDLFL